MFISLRTRPLGTAAGLAAVLLVILLLNLPGTVAPDADAALRVQWDPEAGAFMPIGNDAKSVLDESMVRALNRSAAGLVEERQADGGIGVDLQGRFRSLSVAATAADGSVRTGCVTTRDELDAFLSDPEAGGHGKER